MFSGDDSALDGTGVSIVVSGDWLMTFTKAVSEQHVHVTRSKQRYLLECMSDVDRQGSESERVGAKS